MRCLLVLIGLHAVWTMMDAQRERGHFYGIKSVTSSIKGLAGMLLGVCAAPACCFDPRTRSCTMDSRGCAPTSRTR